MFSAAAHTLNFRHLTSDIQVASSTRIAAQTSAMISKAGLRHRYSSHLNLPAIGKRSSPRRLISVTATGPFDAAQTVCVGLATPTVHGHRHRPHRRRPDRRQPCEALKPIAAAPERGTCRRRHPQQRAAFVESGTTAAAPQELDWPAIQALLMANGGQLGEQVALCAGRSAAVGDHALRPRLHPSLGAQQGAGTDVGADHLIVRSNDMSTP